MEEYDDKALFIRPVPDHIKRRFKAYCCIKRVSMRDAIIAFMRTGPNDGGATVAQIMETARVEHQATQTQETS